MRLHGMADCPDRTYYRHITVNRIKCNHCGDVIRSYSVHDFKTCSCGTVSVDGGVDYLKRCFQVPSDFTEMACVSVEVTKIEELKRMAKRWWRR